MRHHPGSRRVPFQSSPRLPHDRILSGVPGRRGPFLATSAIRGHATRRIGSNPGPPRSLDVRPSPDPGDHPTRPSERTWSGPGGGLGRRSRRPSLEGPPCAPSTRPRAPLPAHPDAHAPRPGAPRRPASRRSPSPASPRRRRPARPDPARAATAVPASASTGVAELLRGPVRQARVLLSVPGRRLRARSRRARRRRRGRAHQRRRAAAARLRALPPQQRPAPRRTAQRRARRGRAAAGSSSATWP